MRIEAIILKKIQVKEFDELVVCYTAHEGKQAYYAKSSLRPRSKQASHLNVLNHTDFDLVEGKNMPILVSARCVTPFFNIRSSLRATSAAYWIIELFDKMVFEGETDQRLWQFLSQCLAKFDSHAVDESADWSDIIEQTRHDFLGVMGYGDDFRLEELAHAKLYAGRFVEDVLKLA